MQYLLDYLEQPNPQCCLVFCGDSALGKTGALNKKLQEKAVQVDFAPLKGKVLEQWIVAYVTAAGRSIDRQAVEYLSAINGFDLQILEQELIPAIPQLQPQDELQLLLTLLLLWFP